MAGSPNPTPLVTLEGDELILSTTIIDIDEDTGPKPSILRAARGILTITIAILSAAATGGRRAPGNPTAAYLRSAQRRQIIGDAIRTTGGTVLQVVPPSATNLKATTVQGPLSPDQVGTIDAQLMQAVMQQPQLLDRDTTVNATVDGVAVAVVLDAAMRARLAARIPGGPVAAMWRRDP